MKSSPVVRRAFTLILAVCTVFLSGCPDKATPPPAKKTPASASQPLVLLVVDDPELGRAAAGAWRGRTEEELTVRNVSLAEVAAASRLPGDAIIFASGMIGHLAERGLISPLEPAVLEDADFNYRDIFDQIRLGEMRWGGQVLAVPLGSPQLLLVYRADVFEKLGLKPPEDWAEYQHVVARLADREALGDLAPPVDQPWRATLEPMQAGWSGQLLLARAAAYAMHREQVSPLFRFDTMVPLIDQPPYVRALEELVAAAKTDGFAEHPLTPAEIFAEIRGGHCGMAITWPTAGLSDSATTERDAKLRFALLPGARQAYRFATKQWESRGEEDSTHVPLLSVSGRMAAVTSSTSDPQRAQGFVVWLAGRDVSQQIGPHSGATTLFRNSQVALGNRWTGSLSPDAGRQYAEVLARSLSLPQAFPGLRLPGRPDYLAALDKAVNDALDGNPAEALAEAAKKWSEITDALGVEPQGRANARSLGQGSR